MRDEYIPYGRQVIDETDIAAVADVLRGDWLTTGPLVGKFERAFADFTNAEHAVAVSNGTAALHLCMLAAGIGPGDQVIVPALTFAASANCARYVGADVVFADVRRDTLTIDTSHVASLITARTRAIVTVDYAGLPSDLDELKLLSEQHGLVLIEDACHAPGSTYKDRKVGSIADLSMFSFHPVKHLTTGEGGMVTTANAELDSALRQLRNHGITSDHRQRAEEGTWTYDMTALGYNYRLSDLQCALGVSQLQKLPKWLERRRELASQYTDLLKGVDAYELPVVLDDRDHAWHLYPIRVTGENPDRRRAEIFNGLRDARIGVNVHYLPVYLHTYYQSLGYEQGLCPVAEDAYARLLSLPMWHGLSDEEQRHVVSSLKSLA